MEDKIPFPGFGTPIVHILDGGGNPIISLSKDEDRDYSVALERFSYEYKEKEEDKCTVVMCSTNIAMMDDLSFKLGQKLKVKWGYLSGDICTPIEVVIVDIRESYSLRGYELTLECSDNLSTLSNGFNPTKVSLNSGDPNLDDLDSPVQIDTIDPIMYGESIENWAKLKGELVKVIKQHPNPFPKKEEETDPDKIAQNIINTEIQLREVGKSDSELPLKEVSNLALVRDHTITQYNTYTEWENATPGVFNTIIRVVGLDPNFKRYLIQPNIRSAENLSSATEHKAIKLPAIVNVPGSNSKQLIQNVVNRISSTPKQVTGRDGKTITYDKRRALAAPAVTSFTWRAEGGRLLEFTYDTNSKYSKGSNVLSQYTVDPETGALTRRDYIQDKGPYVPSDELLNILEALPQPHIQRLGNMNSPLGNWIRKNSKEAYLKQETSTTSPLGVAASDQVEDQTRRMSPYYHLPPNFLSPVKEQEDLLDNENSALAQGDGERIKATAKILGDPQLCSGVNVEINGISKAHSGKYFLTSVSHEITPAAGFICTLEGYLAESQAINISKIKSTVEKPVIEDKAKKIKNDIINSLNNFPEVKQRGYYVVSDIPDGFEALSLEKQKAWATNLPGQIYSITLRHTESGQIVGYRVKVPIDPKTGTFPRNVFGLDTFYSWLDKVAGGAGESTQLHIRKVNPDGSLGELEPTSYPGKL